MYAKTKALLSLRRCTGRSELCFSHEHKALNVCSGSNDARNKLCAICNLQKRNVYGRFFHFSELDQSFQLFHLYSSVA